MVDLGNRDVFVDLSTQHEYLDRDAPGCCANAEPAIAGLKRMMALIRLTKAPLISCVDGRRENQFGPDYVPVVSSGSPLRQKLSFTLLAHRTLVESDNCLCVPLDLLQRYQQAIFTKAHRDPFTNPKLDRLLTEAPARRFVLFGAPLESSVRMLALGLLRRMRPVTLVADACAYWNADEAAMVTRQLDVKGCEVVLSTDLVSATLAQLDARRKQRSRRWVA